MDEGIDSMQKLTKALNMLRRPVKLSEEEKAQLRSSVELIKGALDDVLKKALILTKEEGFALVAKYANVLSHVEEQPEPALNSSFDTTSKDRNKQIPQTRKSSPVLNEILEGLEPEMQVKAKNLLDCVKAAESQEGTGDQVLCPYCDVNEMRKCIRTADPSIVDEMDKDLEKRRKGTS